VAFELAEIHPSPFSFAGQSFHVAPLSGDRFLVHQATPLDLIRTAYGAEPDAVTGGPPGLEFDRYEIVAKLPPGTAKGDTARMLQSLLADRFKLVIQTEMKPLPAFLLSAGKGSLKMKPAADPAGDSVCRYQPDPPSPLNTPSPATITLKCSNMTMEHFAVQLRGFGSAYLNHPVVETTGLNGAWDFDLRFSLQPGVADGVTLFAAVDRLGLKLEAGMALRQAIAITSMAETPAPNFAGIERLMPPVPLPSFEVAVIRPSHEEYKEVQIRLNGSQVTISATELRLIAMAWDISVKTVFDGPASMDDKVWEITAKLPAPDSTSVSGAHPAIDFDQVRLMMRSLLAERFGLKVRREERPGSAYTLLAGIQS
jgi:uncharacterized protein (TIGR03435 family)